VINNKVGAYSLDGLQEVANYTMFYESPVSPIDREQAERRLRREGQKRRVFQYDLVTRGTVDEKILTFHAEGEELFKALVRNPKSILTSGR
jgi:SNF2 family DNA or RNA helicase